MPFLHYLITSAMLALVLRWLWKAARSEKAKAEPGRQVFPAIKPVRFLLILFATLFAALAVVSVLFLHKPGSWWVPYFFLGFVALVLLSYPPVLTIETDGVGSRSWFGKEKKLRWEDIASLHYNPGNRYFTLRGVDGRKITHSGFNADADAFRTEIQTRTACPSKLPSQDCGRTKVSKFRTTKLNRQTEMLLRAA